MSKPRGKTFERIVRESLALFNEHGERNVTTNHIAAHLGISPGNLYYHFRNKEEIVYQIFCQYRDCLTERLAMPVDRALTAADLGAFLDTAFDVMWRYRFLFHDQPGLLARNPQLQQDYLEFVNSTFRALLFGHFREFVRLGLLRIDDADIEPVMLNIWLVVKFWFAFEEAAHPHDRSGAAYSRRGVRQVLTLLKPYVQPDFQPVFNALLERTA
ncbi:TetR family transcriptional regulator [Crenobacter luteus]|uniref:TetR family transcriptional regulator n=1 Tax=Crenobacter luteus TaxID=1452487 RepID=A0A163DNV4_9NEIS|nr:TetR/AcrR family transcriptional regulator [Crenobacter luteus]KZE35077.1 TetR family transcriptional regulator [Crenobacter luteus]TCP11247.1 TetR family transcriptional regulator [Crenobacter luteus]